MSKPAIATYDAVAAACESITAAGGRVSVRAVIEQLGGGSPNAVTKHLRDWREQKPLIEARKSIMIDGRIATLIADQIEQAVTEARSEADAERAAAISDYELLANTGRDLEQRNQELEAQVAAAAEREQHHAGVIEQLRADIVVIKSEASEQIEKANAEAVAERAKSDALAGKFGAEQARAESLQEEVAKLARRLADVQGRLDAEHAARTEAEKALAVSEATLTAQTSRLADAVKARAEAEAAFVVERDARATAETSAAKAQAQADERGKFVASLEARLPIK